MLKYGEKIAIGVSGGKDSLALLDILVKMQRDNEYELVAITIDEGIKNYRDEAVELAIKACKKYLSLIHISEPTRLLSIAVCRLMV